MASTFTNLGIELMATGENAGTWGTKTNANLNLAEQLLGGFKIQTLNAAGSGANTTALAVADGALTGAAQNRVIILGAVSPEAITGNKIVTVPLLTETFYIMKNSTSGAYTVQLKAASGSGATVTWSATDKGYKLVYIDGVATNTGVIEAPLGLQEVAANSITTAMIQDDAVTTAKIADSNVTVAKMAANSVDSDQYVDGSIDTAHIANDQITNALMADNAIDTAQIAASAVETAKINDSAVSTAKIADNAITLAKMASGTDGNLISFDTSGNPVAVATGSAGQLLTSAGAGAVPSFQAAPGGGKILQVKTAFKPERQTFSSTSFTDVANMSVTLTPASSSSKIFVTASFTQGNNGYQSFINLVRGSTAIAQAQSSGSGSTQKCTLGFEGTSTTNLQNGSFVFLDSPSTGSETTYKIQLAARSGGSITLGGVQNTTLSYFVSAPCMMVVMEVAG